MARMPQILALIFGRCRHRLSSQGASMPSDRGIIDACRVQLAAPGGRDPGRAAVRAPAGTPGAHWGDGRGVLVVGRADQCQQRGLGRLLRAVGGLERAGSRHLGDGARRRARGDARPPGAGFPRRPAALALAWTALLITAGSLSGRAGLGTALTAAFLLQVTPSVWTAYRADHTTGIATGTWLLILGELLCWGVFGIYESDPRLIVLGRPVSRPACSSWPGWPDRARLAHRQLNSWR